MLHVYMFHIYKIASTSLVFPYVSLHAVADTVLIRALPRYVHVQVCAAKLSMRSTVIPSYGTCQ